MNESPLPVIDLLRHLPYSPGKAVEKVLLRDLHFSPIQYLDKAARYLDDAREHQTLYRFKGILRDTASEFIAAEPNALVVSFLSALCLNGIDHGWVRGREPDYDLARDVLEALRQEYPA